MPGITLRGNQFQFSTVVVSRRRLLNSYVYWEQLLVGQGPDTESAA